VIVDVIRIYFREAKYVQAMQALHYALAVRKEQNEYNVHKG